MTVTVGVRDLRNRTADVLKMAISEGEVVITSNGKPVAVLRPYQAAWKAEASRLLHLEGAPTDSGLAAMLALDDDASMDDLA
jgi:prevent-host-death family protein